MSMLGQSVLECLSGDSLQHHYDIALETREEMIEVAETDTEKWISYVFDRYRLVQVSQTPPARVVELVVFGIVPENIPQVPRNVVLTAVTFNVDCHCFFVLP